MHHIFLTCESVSGFAWLPQKQTTKFNLHMMWKIWRNDDINISIMCQKEVDSCRALLEVDGRIYSPKTDLSFRKLIYTCSKVSFNIIRVQFYWYFISLSILDKVHQSWCSYIVLYDILWTMYILVSGNVKMKQVYQLTSKPLRLDWPESDDSFHSPMDFFYL